MIRTPQQRGSGEKAAREDWHSCTRCNHRGAQTSPWRHRLAHSSSARLTGGAVDSWVVSVPSYELDFALTWLAPEVTS